MHALIFDSGVRYEPDYPMPKRQAHESLIRVRLAAICNTDREILRGYRPDFTGVLGHEFVGEVVESDREELVGRRVVGELNEACGHCLYCTTGRPHHCINRKVIGMSRKDGCFAEYLTIATDLLHPVPDGLTDQEAIFTEPLAAALEIPEQVHLRPSVRVGIIGDGRLAYMIAQVVAQTGADVTVIGRHDAKLRRFAAFAETTRKPHGSFETVIECSGNPSGLHSALRLTRSGGTLVLKSTYAAPVELQMSELVVREITLVGSRCGPFGPALNLLARRRIQLPPVDWYDLADYTDAFESQAMKVGFRL